MFKFVSCTYFPLWEEVLQFYFDDDVYFLYVVFPVGVGNIASRLFVTNYNYKRANLSIRLNVVTGWLFNS